MYNFKQIETLNYIMYVIGHRGLSHAYPENSLLSFQKAIELGVDMLELDVRRTKDGQLVVSHNLDLLKCTRKPGNINELTYDEILTYDLGMDQKVPLLEDVLKLIQNKPVKLNIELKEYETEEDIVALVKKMGVENQILYSSFTFAILLEIRDIDPDAVICTVVGNTKLDQIQTLIDQAKLVKASYINLNENYIYKDIVDLIHSVGLGIMAWNVDSSISMTQLIALGVDGIFTNEAERLKDLLASKNN